MALAAGTRLGPYEVLGLIGAGGMGEVYKARDTRLDRTVAIKVLARRSPLLLTVAPASSARRRRSPVWRTLTSVRSTMSASSAARCSSLFYLVKIEPRVVSSGLAASPFAARALLGS
jgi:serine/threonine protein kinase